MPYYHVYIESNDPRAQCFELDKTELSELKEDVILPYLKGDQFHCDGYLLRRTKVERILIMKSDISYEEYDKLRRQRSRYVLKSDIIASPEYFNNITGEILKECQSLLEEATTKSEAPTAEKPKASMDKSKVFIVHGHDNAAKEAVARFIEKIGLDAIILHEQASSGNTIIEKIEANSNVGFGIVLYTPCDLGASQEKKDELKPRARQNVVFEHGYLIGKIGRKNVCALLKGDIETPNDISGVVYIKMDEGDGWKLAVAKEMKKSGYDVDLNKI